MTVLVGVLCSDGAVIGSDTQMTSLNGMGLPTTQDTGRKLHVYSRGEAVLGYTGDFGEFQRLTGVLQKAVNHISDKQSSIEEITDVVHQILPSAFVSKVKGAARAIQEATERTVTNEEAYAILQSLADRSGGGFLALILNDNPAIVGFDGLSCYSLSAGDRVAVAMGSGSEVASPFLSFIRRVLWRNELPSVDDATVGVLWVIRHAIQYAGIGVGGRPEIAVLRKLSDRWTPSLLGNEQMKQLEGKVSDIESRVTGAARVDPITQK